MRIYLAEQLPSLASCEVFSKLTSHFTCNTVMRRLLGLPPWASASQMFATLCVRSFQETHRVLTYSLMKRVDVSLNSVMSVLRSSDASLVSTIRENWRKILYVNY